MALVPNVTPPTEGVRYMEPNTCAVLNNKEIGNVTLYITLTQVVWVGEKGESLILEYETITVHAVSRNLNSFPEECLYLVICMDGNEEIQSGDSDEEYFEERKTEIRFIPLNRDALNVMFKTMSECRALNSMEEFFSDDEEDGWVEAGAGDVRNRLLYSHKNNIFAHLTSVL